MKLYYSPGACSLAAHIILNEINVDFDLEKVNLKTHQTEKGGSYYDINPKGYVPALEINPGLILTENVAILPFLAQHDPKQDLIPPSGLGRAKVLEWLGYLNSELHDAYSVFFGAPLNDEAKQKAYTEVDRLLTYIDTTIGKSDHNYLVDDNFGPADAYLFVITNWSNLIKHDLSPYSNILKLREKVAARQSVQIAMRDEGLIA